MAAGIELITLTLRITNSDIEILLWSVIIGFPIIALVVIALTYFFNKLLHGELKKKRRNTHGKKMSKEDAEVADMLEDYLRNK